VNDQDEAPPQDAARQGVDLAAERAVVASILVKPELFWDLDLRSDEFFLADARELFCCIAELSFDGVPVDPITLADRMGGKWTPDAVTSWKEGAAEGAKFLFCAERVRETSIDRATRDAARGILSSEDHGSDLLASSTQTLLDLAQTDKGKGEPVRLAEVLSVVVTDLSVRRAGGESTALPLVQTGIPEVDRFMEADRGSFYTFAGRPSMGKSAFTEWLAIPFLERGERILWFTTESTKEAKVKRLLSQVSRVSTEKMRKAASMSQEEFNRITSADALLHAYPVWFDDRSRTLAKIGREVRRHKSQNEITMVIFDHLQEASSGDRKLMSDPSGVAEANRIVDSLRTLCQDNPRCTLVLVSQLNREVERRDDKHPMLSDLKQTGKLEEASDVVGLVYRASYYEGPTTKHKAVPRGAAPVRPDVMEINFAKHRDGPVGTVRAFWEESLGQVGGIYDMQDHVWNIGAQVGLTFDGSPYTGWQGRP
jgi:replicative DNA helicase